MLKAPSDLSILPRPFTLVADLIRVRTGVRISSQRVQHVHDAAIRKIRKALARELGK